MQRSHSKFIPRLLGWNRTSYMLMSGFIAVVLLILTSTDYRFAVLTFIAGTGLGYFLEVWGTHL